MSLSPSDGPESRAPSPIGHDTHGLSIVHDELPPRWWDAGIAYGLTRLGATTWRVTSDDAALGVLTLVPPLSVGEPETWRIGDPAHQDLGVGASWSSWEDAVANLVDYRRRH